MRHARQDRIQRIDFTDVLRGQTFLIYYLNKLTDSNAADVFTMMSNPSSSEGNQVDTALGDTSGVLTLQLDTDFDLTIQTLYQEFQPYCFLR